MVFDKIIKKAPKVGAFYHFNTTFLEINFQ
jgi:hypothetical protein